MNLIYLFSGALIFGLGFFVGATVEYNKKLTNSPYIPKLSKTKPEDILLEEDEDELHNKFYQ